MPCSCLDIYIPPPPPCTDCFKLGSILSHQCNNANPCGGTGSIPFDCFQNCCTGTISFEVFSISHPDKITITSLTNTGLSYSTLPAANANDRIEIILHGRCAVDSCNILDDYMSIIIYINDPCRSVICPQGSHCNQCNGLCEPDLPEVEIGSTSIINEIGIS